MTALLLSRREVKEHLSPADCLAAVEEAFRASRSGAANAPAPLHLVAQSGGFHAKGALLARPERTYAAVKLNANFPGNRERAGRPTIQGVIVLCDASDGTLLAILDSIEITLLRTGAASALAARHLARKDASSLLICGCGDQASYQVSAIAQVRPIKRGFAYDVDESKATAFARNMQAQGIPFEPVRELGSAARRSGIVVTCTTARSPILSDADVSPGTFIAAVGADNPEKCEIAPSLMARARVVVDALEQCAVMGDLHHALKAGLMSAADVKAELADILAGACPSRTNDEEITIFDSTGTALQDVACAALAFVRAAAGKYQEFRFA